MPPPPSFEVYMQLTDRGRKKLLTVMEIQEVSARRVAAAAGWKSHTIMVRLLKGTTTTLTPDRAVKIATFLGVPVNDLFVPRSTTVAGQIVKPTVPARRTAKAAA